MMRREPAPCSLLHAALILILVPASAPVVAQEVQGIDLGRTHIRELVRLRGQPTDTGQNNDGWKFVAYGIAPTRTTIYFATEDSIAEWLRVFPERGRTSARVREAFGKPDTTQFGEDLSKSELFRGGLVVVKYNDDNTVNMIEYHAYRWNRIGYRRSARADKMIDSILVASLTPFDCSSRPCDLSTLADSVTYLRRGKASVTVAQVRKQPVAPWARAAAAKFDSLCVLHACAGVLQRFRAYDDDP